jgi:hypothetical protein
MSNRRGKGVISDIAKSVGTVLGKTKIGKEIGAVASKVKDFFTPAAEYPNSAKLSLQKHGNKRITAISIRRAPINGIVSSLLNVATLGAFNKAVASLGYDKMFHLSMVVVLEDNTRLIIEKNARVNVSPFYEVANAELRAIAVRRPITLGELMLSGEKLVGEYDWFKYDAFARNCQMFITAALRGSGLYSDGIGAFINQDAQTLIKKLPAWASSFARFFTDAGGLVARGRIPQSRRGGRR